MWRDNPTWGEDRITAEMAKLGYDVDSRTVAKYRPSGLSRGRGQRWTTFIRNNHGWPHRGFHMQSPDGARHLAPPRPTQGTRIVAAPILGGLHHGYGSRRRDLHQPSGWRRDGVFPAHTGSACDVTYSGGCSVSCAGTATCRLKCAGQSTFTSVTGGGC
jgi:hypothetical protein